MLKDSFQPSTGLKVCLGIHFASALVAGPMMLLAPKKYIEGNVDVGKMLGDSEAAIRALPVDELHVRFVGAAVCAVGLSLTGQALFLVGSNLTALATILRTQLIWCGLCSLIAGSFYYNTGLKFANPLGVMCAFHYGTYLYFYLNLPKAKSQTSVPADASNGARATTPRGRKNN